MTTQNIGSWLALSFLCISCFAFGQSKVVQFQTIFGNVEVELFDDTPNHRNMFLKAISDSTYHQALFNRVIKGFVNQGGELDETILEEEKSGQREKLRLAHEILPHHIHARGVLGAGRDDNPEKASYLSQIYFVIGKVFTEKDLVELEQKRAITIPKKNRKIYKKIGGTPHLDGGYTIFGRVKHGLDVIQKINEVQTNRQDVPIEPVIFSVIVIK